VYDLAAYLGVPGEIRQRQPTTDTYTLEQSQEEFYFMVPLDKMDLCLYGKNNGIGASELAVMAGMDETHVERVYQLVESGRRAAEYLIAEPQVIE
jgi:NAD+ synthase